MSRWRLEGKSSHSFYSLFLQTVKSEGQAMPRWLGILSIIFFLVSCANMDLNITRGITDKFTNPRCVGGLCTESAMSINCDGLNGADCISQNCFECECDGTRPTFYQSGYLDGKCVKNEKLSVSLDDSDSFLAKHSWGSCMVPLPSDQAGLTVDTCDVSNTRQHWIWTKNNQLLNIHTVKCLQTSEIPIFREKYPKVSLTPCNASDLKQIWKCRPKSSLFYLEYEKAYLNFGNVQKYVIVYSGTWLYSWWGRYQTDQSLCSSITAYHGCYKYSDGSSMFTIETEALNKCDDSSVQCEEGKNIFAPVEVTNHHCSIQWERTKFLNYSQWNYLPRNVLDRKPFYLVKRNSTTITLKVKLAASQHLRGQIIRLYIWCGNTVAPVEQGENETHCVLVKFSGNFDSLFSVHLSTTVQTRMHTMSKLTLPTTGSVFQENESTVSTHGSGSSTVVTIIVVSSLLSFLLLLAAIILLVIFKQKRCCMKKTQQGTGNDLYERKTMRLANSGETLNPIYSSSDTRECSPKDITAPCNGYELPKESALSECALYESNTLIEPNVSENTNYECVPNITTSHPGPDALTQ